MAGGKNGHRRHIGDGARQRAPWSQSGLLQMEPSSFQPSEVHMLKLSVRREPLSDHSYFAEKSYEASLTVVRMDDDNGCLGLRFATNPNGRKVNLFGMSIPARHFAELARMMVEADPAAAIHAFGAAMQTADVERRRPAASNEEAA
jgi:hypothetical protein